MTNTKFRKRALLSSVAMLLVALVALGSATFAWFSTTNNATASSMTAKTNMSSNILLSEMLDGATPTLKDWTQNLSFTEGTSDSTDAMVPVTTANYTAWNKVTIDKYNQGFNPAGATGYTSCTSTIKTDATLAKYSTLYLKNTGEDDEYTINTSVTYANGSNTKGIDYVRVALVPIAVSTSAKTTAAGSLIVFGDGDDRAKETDGWKASSETTANTTCTGVMNTAQSLGTLTKDDVYGYDVYVYFEGNDFDCVDEAAGGNFTVSFSVEAA